ncbi:type I-E CRISPR-associated protein Cse1/CasA [Streptomyces sp. NBC_01803]|uniref:type I-E CRISPR-associated protein Cse1/CasA n=1 Tax=Streptomyces sp. NBC_01803 TaxID=2975946 RepID=UPI002DDB27B6|nr:type I-E CRISPR-associated protein Cse1/CasA [Streptomyces sp. NBC_01803]WSA46452.1 type I-E CRISPR-associated protein Cse1/CasA [Streptomyces sp. NBC_01803]
MPLGGSPGFDLFETGWLDVEWVDPDRDQRAVGFREALVHSHEIAGLRVGSPPALSALYRVLYALTARVTGLDEAPDGPDEWCDRRDDLLEEGIDPGEVDAYFTSEIRARFDLFGDQPFLQDPRLRQQCAKSAGVNKLVLGRPAGNNHSWFGHHRDAEPYPVASAEAVLHLLTWLYYGPSGRCSSRTVGRTTAADVRAGPLRSSLSYHPEGPTLLHTLLAGLTPPGSEEYREDDPCPWEREPEPDVLAEPPGYRGPCSRLTGGWQHALLLVPDATGEYVTDAYITWGTRLPAPPTDDAYVIWQTSQAGNVYARPADSARALWRDLDALLLPRANGSAQPRRPRVLGGTLPDLPDLRLRALGFEQDGQTRDTQFVSASTPSLLDVVKAREEGTARRIGDTRETAERYGRRVEYAVKRAWATLTNGKVEDCLWSEEAAVRYWPAAGTAFWDILAEGTFDQARRIFLGHAHGVFDRVTDRAPLTCRATAAVEGARIELHGGRRAIPRRAADTGRTTTQETSMDTPLLADTAEPEKEKTPTTAGFVARVRWLCANDPGARAALRSGLRRPVDQCPRMHRYLADLIPDEHRHGDDSERAYYAVAAMMANLDPAAREVGRPPGAGTRIRNAAPTEGGETASAEGDAVGGPVFRNFGTNLAEAVGRDPRRERGVEARLDAMAKQSVEGIHRHLPAAVDLITDQPYAVDWVRLILDLREWGSRRDRVCRRWMQSYYRERQRAVTEAANETDA